MGPWFVRGNAMFHGSGAGVFTLHPSYGTAGDTLSFRVVLSM